MPDHFRSITLPTIRLTSVAYLLFGLIIPNDGPGFLFLYPHYSSFSVLFKPPQRLYEMDPRIPGLLNAHSLSISMAGLHGNHIGEFIL